MIKQSRAEQSRIVGWNDEVAVTMEDGQVVRCRTEPAEPNRERRWVFRSSDGRVDVGPPWWGPTTAEELRRLVDRWWRIMDAGAGR